ncbi:transposase [Streptomyces sp. NBC_01017]|uniref:transposase n=1 Tax=Streptomyces sp. NBC_01017 TaxID=2903721 RepID=UPI0038672758
MFLGPGPFLTGSGHPTPPCCDVSKQPPSATVNWRKRTGSCGRRSPSRSGNDAPPTCQTAAATHRGRNLPPSSDHADEHVEDTVHHTSRQVSSTRVERAQDKGRKRGLAVDVLGLIIGVVVLAASAHDNAAGTALLDQAAERCGNRLEKALVDQGFKDEVIIHGALLDITVEVVRRNPADKGKGFVPQPKRWVVEQVNGTLMLHRRLAREYDHRPDTSASRVYWASTANMSRRLTTPTPTWRDTLRTAA